MIGVDEVGRGCWAGPLLVVAVRARDDLPAGLADSKTLAKKRREELAELLLAVCDFGEGWVEPAEIDALGLTGAMKLGVARAFQNLKVAYDEEVIMDGAINYCAPAYVRVNCVVRADANHSIVSAASIYAKVRRDARMTELAKTHPDYGFDRHVGYGTAAHLGALRKYGLTPLHRKSYKPVRQFI